MFDLHQLGHPRLVVIGDLMLDRYLWGTADRVSPEAPVLVLTEDLDEVRPGGAANVAAFLRGLEADVTLAGLVGDDTEGRTLVRILNDQGVDTSFVTTADRRPTTLKQRVVGRTAQRQPHQIVRIDREVRTPIPVDLERQVLTGILPAVSACDAVLISDYDKGVCTPGLLRPILDEGRRLGIPVLIDPCRGGDFLKYSRATAITPNRRAAELWASCSLHDPENIQHIAERLRERLALDAAILTLDRDGLAYATPDARGLVPGRPRDVADVTGAGDMVLAMLGLCFAGKVPLMESLHWANTAAGLEVERRRREASAAAADTLDAILPKIAEFRRAGCRIVFTNGCFDLLHVGHVQLLEDAARLGDVLIVAINSDESVRRLKGPERPIIGESGRARMLASLACVDHVLIFDEATPHRLLEAIRPDVLVKGGTTGHIVGREIVEAYGGTVTRTPTVPGCSTTDLLSRVRSSHSNHSGSLKGTSECPH